jgi:hypothetical protein
MTKAERIAKHKNKMLEKARRRYLMWKSTPEPMVLANISRKHPDYGMSPREHEEAKRQRAENNS